MLQLSTDTLRAIGVLFIRSLLGLIFLMQGWGKVFTWGVEGVYQSAFKGLESSWIPEFLLRATTYYTSFAELLGGLLLILGLFRHFAYLALGLVLLLVSYGHGLEAPIWDLQHVMYRAMLLIPLFFFPQSWDKYHLDQYISSKFR